MGLLDRFRKQPSVAAVQIPASFPLDWLLDAGWSAEFFSIAHDKTVGIVDKDGVFFAMGVLATYITSTGSEIDLLFMGRGIKYSGAHPLEAQYTPTGRFSNGSTVYASRALFLQKIDEVSQVMAREGTRVWDGFTQFRATVVQSRGPGFLYE